MRNASKAWRRRQIQVVCCAIVAIAILSSSVFALPSREERRRLLEERIRQLRASITTQTPDYDLRRFTALIRILTKATQPFQYTVTSRLGSETCSEYRIDPNAQFDRDTIITCHRIVIPRDAKIRVTGGRSLYLESDTVQIEGTATINGNGQRGITGTTGPSVTGVWTSRGDGDFNGALNDCRNNTGHRDRGGKGGAGGAGENGAVIIMLADPIGKEHLSVTFKGGDPGDGGPGGTGMLYKNGRNNYCDGCTMNCPSGDRGDPGSAGVEGDWIILAN